MKIQFQKILLLFILISTSTFALGQNVQELPALDSHVTDYTSTLTSFEISSLENYLSEFEKIKGSQVVVLIISTTDPEAIESYSIRLAEKWKIGRKNVDDGVILIVAKDDRKLRIEVGYGLEGAIPDIYAKRIIENKITPEFRQGLFYEGIEEGLMAIISLIEGEELPAVTTVVETDEDTSGTDEVNPAFTLVIAFLLLIFNVAISSKLIKGGIAAALGIGIWIFSGMFFAGVFTAFIALIFLFASGSGGGGGYRSSYGGGGFSSGGSSGGGFSGGGGSFGGGGASGGW